uniref:Retrotransposon gag domain-containing protein n=1 Tax=Tanacetum cinerariifolium TaxID=118510 RepID=A0A6L2M6I0_TANCI|nr:hypothetical protein [Tanacetum cinerariifolium]
MSDLPSSKGILRFDELGDEGLCSRGAKLNLIFTTAEPMEEVFQGMATRDVGTETHGEPTEPVLQTQKTASPSLTFIKENIHVLRTMIKEHDQQAKMKATPRKLAYADSDKEAPVGQTCFTIKSQKTPSKNKEPTRLTRLRRLEDQRKTKEKARRERSKPRRKRSGHQETSSDSECEKGKTSPDIRVYEGNKDPKDHLGIFSTTVEQKEWPTPIWCKMFRQTLGGVAQNWFNDLDPKSVDSFEELSQNFLDEFSQQKRYAKNPTEIHGIKRRPNEDLQAFMDLFKSESSHIKGVPPVLRISAFMHGHGHPKLAKKLNDKIRKTINEMRQSLAWTGGPERARNRGGPKERQRNMRVYTPYPRKYTFTPLTKTLKEILAMESVSFLEPPPLIKTPEKQNLNKLCDYHGDRGHNTNVCYQLKKQIEKVVASGKLAHLVKDIHQNNQWSGNQGRNGIKVQGSDDRFFRRNISPLGGNRPSSNYKKGRKKQYGANGVRNNKMSFTVQHHNRNDHNEKPRSSREGRLGKWATEIRAYGISYVKRKEVEVSMLRKLFGEGERVGKMPNANKEETLNLSKKLYTKSTPTPRAWRLYLCKEVVKEGSGIGIIQVIPKENMYLYAIRLKFKASNYAMDSEPLLAGLATSANQGIKEFYIFINSLTLVAQVEGNHMPATKYERRYKKEIMDAAIPFHRFRITHLPKILNLKAEVLKGLATIKLEFLNHEVSVGIKTRPSMTSNCEKGKAISNALGTKPNCSHEAGGSN